MNVAEPPGWPGKTADQRQHPRRSLTSDDRRRPEVLATLCEAAPVVLLGPVGLIPARAGQRLTARH
jgi:hypothetical protein